MAREHRRTFAGRGQGDTLRAIKQARGAFADLGRLAARVTDANAKESCHRIAVLFESGANKLDMACNVYRRDASSQGSRQFDAVCEAGRRRQEKALKAGERACDRRFW